MTKKESFELMNLIAEYYEQFSYDQTKLDAWHQALKLVPFEEAKQNLIQFTMESPFPPKLSDLVRKKPSASRDIPNVAETLKILYNNLVPAKEETVQRELAKMREILGIKRG